MGSYFRIRKEGDEWINWEWTSRKIFNFIRAITDPGPCAQTMFKENLIKIRNSKEIPNSPKYFCVPGEIVGKTDDSLILKTGDSTLSINSYDSLDKKNDMAAIIMMQMLPFFEEKAVQTLTDFEAAIYKKN